MSQIGTHLPWELSIIVKKMLHISNILESIFNISKKVFERKDLNKIIASKDLLIVIQPFSTENKWKKISFPIKASSHC